MFWNGETMWNPMWNRSPAPLTAWARHGRYLATSDGADLEDLELQDFSEARSQFFRWGNPLFFDNWVWVNTYRYIFSGMNIHLHIYIPEVMSFLVTIWLFNSLPWKDPPFLIGKPSISMGHDFHGELLNNQRVMVQWISINDILFAHERWGFH